MSAREDSAGVAKGWVLFCALLLLLSAPITGLVLARTIRHGQASERWPSVEGKVLRAAVREVGRGKQERYQAVVEYRYEVNGLTYVGKRLGANNWEADKPWPIQEALRGIAAGKKARVYYRPENPADSLLRPGVIHNDYFVLVIPFVLFIFGACMLMLFYITTRRG